MTCEPAIVANLIRYGVSPFDAGYGYCRICAEYVNKSDPKEAYASKGRGAIVHSCCGHLLAIKARNSAWRERRNQKHNVKRL